MLERSVGPAKSELLKLLVGTLGAMLAAAAAAEVSLETSVEKWESYEDAFGTLKRRLVDAETVLPGDELRYTITFMNHGPELVDAGSIVITNPLPEGTDYLLGTAAGVDTLITLSTDGEQFAAADTSPAARFDPAPAPDATGSVAAPEVRAIRWAFEPSLEPGESSFVTFEVRLR